MVSNSTQLWYGENVGFGIVKKYADLLFTYENKSGDYAYLSLDGNKIYISNGEGAWNDVRKEAELHMYKLDKGI